MSALIPVAGAATGPVVPPTAATGGSGTTPTISRTLREGVDDERVGDLRVGVYISNKHRSASFAVHGLDSELAMNTNLRPIQKE